MATKISGIGVLAAAFALTVVGVAPASAEFFGCNEPHTKISYSTRAYNPAPQPRYTARYTHEFAAQRSRHATYSRRPYTSSSSRWR